MPNVRISVPLPGPFSVGGNVAPGKAAGKAVRATGSYLRHTNNMRKEVSAMPPRQGWATVWLMIGTLVTLCLFFPSLMAFGTGYGLLVCAGIQGTFAVMSQEFITAGGWRGFLLSLVLAIVALIVVLFVAA